MRLCCATSDHRRSFEVELLFHCVNYVRRYMPERVWIKSYIRSPPICIARDSYHGSKGSLRLAIFPCQGTLTFSRQSVRPELFKKTRTSSSEAPGFHSDNIPGNFANSLVSLISVILRLNRMSGSVTDIFPTACQA